MRTNNAVTVVLTFDVEAERADTRDGRAHEALETASKMMRGEVAFPTDTILRADGIERTGHEFAGARVEPGNTLGVTVDRKSAYPFNLNVSK